MYIHMYMHIYTHRIQSFLVFKRFLYYLCVCVSFALWYGDKGTNIIQYNFFSRLNKNAHVNLHMYICNLDLNDANIIHMSPMWQYLKTPAVVTGKLGSPWRLWSEHGIWCLSVILLPEQVRTTHSRGWVGHRWMSAFSTTSRYCRSTLR